MTVPMLTDFAVRLAGGLAAALLATPWGVVPPGFFRTLGLVILGLIVLAALFVPSSWLLVPTILAGTLAYAATIGWGLGRRRVGAAATAGLLGLCAAVLVAASWSGPPFRGIEQAAARLASAFVLGTTLTAMLLGHHYLTAPAMSIAPLKRFVRLMAIGLGVRAALALPGLVAWWSGTLAMTADRASLPLFLLIRWGMGFAAAGLATWMTWRTVLIRSTQSATGILYIAMTLILFGELTAMVLTRDAGAVF